MSTIIHYQQSQEVINFTELRRAGLTRSKKKGVKVEAVIKPVKVVYEV